MPSRRPALRNGREPEHGRAGHVLQVYLGNSHVEPVAGPRQQALDYPPLPLQGIAGKVEMELCRKNVH